MLENILLDKFLGFNIDSWDTVWTAVIIACVIILIFKILGTIAKRSGTSETDVIETATTTTANSTNNEDEIIAVIAAAIAAFGEKEGKQYTIKSITPVRQKRASGRSAWSSAAAYENTRPF